MSDTLRDDADSVFAILSADSASEISLEDAVLGVVALNLNYDNKLTVDLLRKRAFQSDFGETIGVAAFRSVVVELDRLQPPGHLLQVIYSFFDQDEKGFFSIEEFKQKLGELQFDCEDETICSIFEFIDCNNRGYVVLEDFVNAVKKSDTLLSHSAAV